MATGIDAKKLIGHLGGVTAVHNAFVDAGVAISRKAVEMWHMRESIPGKHIATFIEIGDRQNRKVDIRKFTKK